MSEFEKQVADALEQILEREAAKKEASSTLREYFRGELALRMAAAIEAAAVASWKSAKDTDASRLWWEDAYESAALAALRGPLTP